MTVDHSITTDFLLPLSEKGPAARDSCFVVLVLLRRSNADKSYSRIWKATRVYSWSHLVMYLFFENTLKMIHRNVSKTCSENIIIPQRRDQKKMLP